MVRLAGPDVRGRGPPERLGYGWRMFAFRSWLALSRLDRLLAHAVPAGLFYNASVSAVKPFGARRGAGGATSRA